MIYAVVFFLVVLVDQVSKWHAVVREQATYNQGGVFGWLESRIWMVIVVGVLIAIASQWNRAHHWWQRLGLVLILAGGVSNLLDRMVYGAVVDFIYYSWVNVYGNIADIVLGLGVVVLIAGTGWEQYEKSHRQRGSS